jgi:hypothetical protein
MSTVGGKGGYPLYQYEPSTVAAVIFCILFLTTTLLHLVQMIRTKAWFLSALTIGALCEYSCCCLLLDITDITIQGEFIGYAARAGSSRQEPGHYRLMPFVIQNTYILVAPALFAATIYMILGRVIRLTEGKSHSIINPGRLTKIFVWGDVFCFLLQGAGESITPPINFWGY